MNIIDINVNEFFNGVRKYENKYPQEPIYKLARFILENYWGGIHLMVGAVGAFVLIWNQAFYRYGRMDYDALEKCISKNLPKIDKFKNKNIIDLSKNDEKEIKELFNDFLDALKSIEKKRERKSPVAVSKALHILAPNYFPLWDRKIAEAYGCFYNKNPAEKYIEFMYKMKKVANKIGKFIGIKDKPLLKLIDEYNFIYKRD